MKGAARFLDFYEFSDAKEIVKHIELSLIVLLLNTKVEGLLYRKMQQGI